MIQFDCPHCDTLLTAQDHQAGDETNCRQCGFEFCIPSAFLDDTVVLRQEE